MAETSKLFCSCGIVTICSFVSPTITIREQAKSIIGKANFKEIYIEASFEECAKRDVKGLYKKAKEGLIKNFTGLDAPFEPSIDPFLSINTENDSIDISVNKVFKAVLPLIHN